MPPITAHISPRIPIDTCEGLFKKLTWDYQQLQEGWNEYCTFNFVLTAYHLYDDWISKAGTREQINRKKQVPPIGERLFFTLRDITNASKHWSLTDKSKRKQIVNDVSNREIASWYAYFVAGPVMYVSVGDARPSLPELAHVTMECLEWILNGEQTTFPETLRKQLEAIFRPLC